MSDHIPLDMQTEIVCKVSIKSLIRLRSVSKSWKSLIDSSEFNTYYTLRHPQQQFLLRYLSVDYEQKYISIVDNDDDDTFPKKNVTVPESVNQLDEEPTVVGSSQGLLCFSPKFSRMDRVVIWNPLIRKSVDVPLPNVTKELNEQGSRIGFGVCPLTLDPKIVKINPPSFFFKFEDFGCCYWGVKVFTLSSGTWRSPLSKLPDNPLSIKWYVPKVVNRFIYWFGNEKISRNNIYWVIISFDLTSEEFKPIYLPDKLAHWTTYKNCPLYKLRETLAVLQCKEKDDKQVFKVWVMENGVSKSFTKLYTFNLPYASVRKVLGFSKNDQLIMSTRYNADTEQPQVFETYDPTSKHFNDPGIYGDSMGIDFFFSSYTESLLLLNQPNTRIGDQHDGHSARCGGWKIKVLLYLVPILISLFVPFVF